MLVTSVETLYITLSNFWSFFVFVFLFFGGSGAEGYYLVWPIRGCTAGQGIVFALSVLYKVYNFAESVLIIVMIIIPIDLIC